MHQRRGLGRAPAYDPVVIEHVKQVEIEHVGPRRRRRRRERLPGEPRYVSVRKLVPNMLTAGALVAGGAACYYAAQEGQFDKAIAAIGISFILDGLDGRMARMLRVTSRFGEKFDSIADFTAFGIAPAFVLYCWELREFRLTGMAVAMVYVLCAAYRLARFTRQAKKQKLGTPPSKFFQGCPAPAAAGLALIPPMLSLSPVLPWTAPAWLTAAWTVLIALLMASRIPMISIKAWRVRRDYAGPLMLLSGLVMVGLFRDPWLTASGVMLVYLLSMPGAIVWKRRLKRREIDRRAAQLDAVLKG